MDSTTIMDTPEHIQQPDQSTETLMTETNTTDDTIITDANTTDEAIITNTHTTDIDTSSTPATPALLECHDLSKRFGMTYALEDVNLTLEKGQIVGLLGPNGSGKTTLIKLLNGILSPSHGEILIHGQSPNAKTKKVVSYLPDRTYLDLHMTTEHIIELFKDFYSDFDEQRAYKMLVDLNIDPFRPLKTFSKGTKEKVQLILVMSRHADLYVLDEPIGGVDPASRDYIITTIINNYNPEATVLISTHLITDVENILDRVVFIQNGHIVLNSTVDEVREDRGQSINDLFKEVFRC